MNNDKLLKAIEHLEDNFNKLNNNVLYQIALDMKKFKKLIPSQAYKLGQQLKNGQTIENIIRQLDKYSDLTYDEIKYILELTAKENIAFANTYYKYRGLPPIDYSTSPEFQKLVNSIAQTTHNNFSNLSQTTAIKLLDSNKNPLYLGIKEAYNEVIDRCVLGVSTGQKDYQKAIFETIKQLSDSGIKKIYYDNEGKRAYARRLDSSVRMNVLDGVRQVSMEMQRQFAEDFGANGFEISAHTPCAVDHQDIQGQQYSTKEYINLNNKLKRPIGTMNCTHFAFSIILGVSEPNYSEKELEKMKKDSNKKIKFQDKEYTKYEATQVQRRIETKIRRLKEEYELYKAVDQKAPMIKKKIQQTLELYKNFSDTMGLPYKINRTRLIK